MSFHMYVAFRYSLFAHEMCSKRKDHSIIKSTNEIKTITTSTTCEWSNLAYSWINQYHASTHVTSIDMICDDRMMWWAPQLRRGWTHSFNSQTKKQLNGTANAYAVVTGTMHALRIRPNHKFGRVTNDIAIRMYIFCNRNRRRLHLVLCQLSLTCSTRLDRRRLEALSSSSRAINFSRSNRIYPISHRCHSDPFWNDFCGNLFLLLSISFVNSKKISALRRRKGWNEIQRILLANSFWIMFFCAFFLSFSFTTTQFRQK